MKNIDKKTLKEFVIKSLDDFIVGGKLNDELLRDMENIFNESDSVKNEEYDKLLEQVKKTNDNKGIVSENISTSDVLFSSKLEKQMSENARNHFKLIFSDWVDKGFTKSLYFGRFKGGESYSNYLAHVHFQPQKSDGEDAIVEWNRLYRLGSGRDNQRTSDRLVMYTYSPRIGKYLIIDYLKKDAHAIFNSNGNSELKKLESIAEQFVIFNKVL